MTSTTNIPLSVLGLSPIRHGHQPAEALANTVEPARATEAYGYRRPWISEHHNTTAMASSATAIMIGQVAAATEHIRVGAGGIMLPDHAPYVVAEQFGTLATYHPGRIDLGRAPGTDPWTTRAVADAIGPHRTGLRISPSNPFGDLNEIDPYGTYTALVRGLAPLDLAYLHHSETGTGWTRRSAGCGRRP
ncbi:MsnO8 family LLM class oxidoreductase [Streptomyces sp. NPDC091278]|uniref:MsnO8 family LLM class oxidoreductase n=1 Tax=Streptomyces sp. NPDC091278 TaxID=3155301 RepID=UPI00344D8F71